MTQRVIVSRRVRRPVGDVGAFVCDMRALVAALSTFERCAFVENTDDGELWDVFLRSGTIYLGGRVLVLAEPRHLRWTSVAGTRHTFDAVVDADGSGSVVTLTMAFALSGFGTAWFTELIGRGIVSRTLTAAAEQTRHHLEFDHEGAA